MIVLIQFPKMNRPIAISLSPNTEKDDILLSLKLLFSPWRWRKKESVERLESEFVSIFDNKFKALAVNSGRSAEYLILKALGIGSGDNVAVQSFTCVAVPNPILWLGAKPLYVDVNDDFNIDTRDLKRKINGKTKAIIVQNTFGIPGDLDAIKKIAQKSKSFLIEDCSHALGAKYKGEKVGTLGDISFFSFGRDKIISSVFGGMILCSNDKVYKRIRELRDSLDFPTVGWIVQQLFHPLAFQVILPLYNLGIGKVLLFLLQKLGLLSKAVYEEEKKGKRPVVFPEKMPGALAELALNQLGKLDRFTKHRQRIAKLYFSGLENIPGLSLPNNQKGTNWLRFPITLDLRDSLYSYTRNRGVLLGDWYRHIISPVGKSDLDDIGYKSGSCPNAEILSRSILNLPTYPSLGLKQAKEVVSLIKEWLDIKQ